MVLTLGTEVVHPATTDVVPNGVVHTNGALETTKSASDPQVVDGAHTRTQTPGTEETSGNATEPVVIVAEPDPGTSNVNAQLLDPTTTKSEENNNNNIKQQTENTTNEITIETSEHVHDPPLAPTVNATTEPEITQDQQTTTTSNTTTTTESHPPLTKSNSSNNNIQGTKASAHPHLANMGGK